MNTFVRSVRQIALPVHRILRQRKVRLFFDSLSPSPSDNLLDVGGWIGIENEFADIYNFFPEMASLNLVNCAYGHASFFIGDACKMPFAPRSFDFVFSNAVIEHVGRFEQQQQMANEIRRVARKGYFVSTPNRWFPIDPHSYLPYFHMMPVSVRRLMHPNDDYWMLSPSDMRCLFPDASIMLTPDGTSIIAIGII